MKVSFGLAVAGALMASTACAQTVSSGQTPSDNDLKIMRPFAQPCEKPGISRDDFQLCVLNNIIATIPESQKTQKTPDGSTIHMTLKMSPQGVNAANKIYDETFKPKP